MGAAVNGHHNGSSSQRNAETLDLEEVNGEPQVVIDTTSGGFEFRMHIGTEAGHQISVT